MRDLKPSAVAEVILIRILSGRTCPHPVLEGLRRTDAIFSERRFPPFAIAP